MPGPPTYARQVSIELRGLSREDIPAWNRLLAAAETVDDTGEHYN